MAELQSPLQADKGADLKLQPTVLNLKDRPEFARRSDMDYWQQLILHSSSVQRQDPILLEFATLQRVNLIHVQNELAEIKADIAEHSTTSKEQMEKLRRIMHEYTIALQDFEYISKLPRLKDSGVLLDSRISVENAFPNISERPGAPYDSTYLTLRREIVWKTDAIREFLRKNLHRRLVWTPEERRINRVGYNQGLPPPIYSEFLDRLARFIVAVGGGCALIVPMLVMSFDQSQTKSLVTVSIAVVLFSLAMSLTFKTDNKETLTATATYAAVLVVFIGTSGTGSS